MNNTLHINSVVGDLELINSTVNMSDILLNVFRLFESNKSIPGLILLNEGQFYGLLSRAKFFEVMSKQFMYDIYSKRRVDYFFEQDDSTKYLIVNSSTSILEVAHKAICRSENDMLEPVIVVLGNNEYRLLDIYQLLTAQNKIQLLMNELLKDANNFKNEVLAITAHDLRNPIGTILGFSSLIAESDALEECKNFADYIKATASQMEELVNSFLISAINDSVEFELKFTKFDIIDLMHNVISSFKTTAQKKKQNIVFEAQKYPILITSDRLKIKEIIENLVSNALKYSEENKEVYINIQNSHKHIDIIIKDQGLGFSPSDMEKVFGKFQRLSARPTGNESSTGLGLFITKRIVDKLKGSIDLFSEPQKGSTFTIKLPIVIEK